MRIAFASDDQVSLAAHTGRCAGFMVCALSQGQWTREGFRENPQSSFHREHLEAGDPSLGQAHAHAPGTGRHSHSGLLGAVGDCDALVTRGLGARLIQDLTAAGVRVYVTGLGTVAQAMEAYARGDLPMADAGAACGHPASHEH